jgi:hypothetical protein
MNPVIEFSMAALAWLIALLRLGSFWRKRDPNADRTAVNIALSTLFFAITLTFLVSVFAEAFDRLTANNLSRLIAYCAVTLTLYYTTTSFLVTFPSNKNRLHLVWIKPYMLATLAALTFTYVGFIASTAQWSHDAIPGTQGEVWFKFLLFSYAFILCVVMASASYSYLSHEQVAVTRFRIRAIVLTASGGAAYFFVKLLLIFGYFWPPLGSEPIHQLSMLLMVATALLWTGSFLHNRIYLQGVKFWQGIAHWFAYRELSALLSALDRLCPTVAMSVHKPGLAAFLRNYEYHMYRAVVRILDGKAMLEDYLALAGSAVEQSRWDPVQAQQAARLHELLRSQPAGDDIWEMVAAYRAVSKRLDHLGLQEAGT